MRVRRLIGASVVAAMAPVTFFGSGIVVSGMGASTALADAPAPAATCPADVVPDGVVGATDLIAVLDQWAHQTPTPADVNDDGFVGVPDLLAVILALGPCPDDAWGIPTGGTHVCAVMDEHFDTLDGGCKDLETGLVWGTQYINYTFPAAEQIAADSTEGGFTDWRLPTREELETLVLHEGLAHFAAGFSGSYHWSTTRKGSRRYGVRLSDGDVRLFDAAGASFGWDYIPFIIVRGGDGGGDPPPPPGECNNDGVCDPGEDCETCSDCEGVTNGPPSGRYCCGNGVEEGPEGDGAICDGNH